jgi:F-type H+-transporting ATPase subunit gamma
MSDLKGRIQGLGSIHNITYAMQIVTISRLKRIISGMGRIKDAYGEVQTGLKYLVSENKTYYNRLVSQKVTKEARPLVLLFFSNRGFCGSYNPDLIQAAEKMLSDKGLTFADVDVACFGKKGPDILRRMKITPVMTGIPVKDTFNLDEIKDLYTQVMAAGESGQPVYAVYFNFKSITSQHLDWQSFFPPSVDEFPAYEESVLEVPYSFEQSKEETFVALSDKYYFLKFLYLFRSASSTEFSQRFLLMKGAVDNVKSLSDELNLELNKQRQGKITQEVSEIISTFKVLQKTR